MAASRPNTGLVFYPPPTTYPLLATDNNTHSHRVEEEGDNDKQWLELLLRIPKREERGERTKLALGFYKNEKVAFRPQAKASFQLIS